MTNKILSLILSIILVTSLVGVTSVSAQTAERTVLYEEDFQNFSTKVFNDGFTASGTNYNIADADSKARLNLGKFFKAEIVEMTGYDGKPTEAVKITGNHNATDWTTSAGAGRITLSGLQTALSNITSGTLVYEYKVYSPNAINSAGETINMDIRQYYMSPIVKTNDYYGVGSSYDNASKSNIQTLTTGEWHKFTYVLLLDESRVLVYHNDELVSYKVREVTTKGYRFQVPYRSSVEGAHIIFDDFKVWHTTGTSIADGLTQVTSSLNGVSDASRSAKPQFIFSEMLLDKESSTVDTVSVDNVEMVSSDGTPVAIDSVSLSADKKTLTVDPADELSWSTTYKVKLKNLLNIYQEKIADYEISFTVMDEPPFALVEPVFTQVTDLTTQYQEPQGITALENGYINAKYGIVNNHDTDDKNVLMFAVLREDGALKAIEFKQATIKPRGSVEFNAGFEIDDYRNQSIELFVWDNFADKNALAVSYVLDSNGITSTEAN
ncbi:MAG: Ig-like domain-containing protein [Clostridia bacterium]|nr:Ig-like domain-containing protein [Clostridia bacterium]